MVRATMVFTDDFEVKPYWWDAAPPERNDDVDLPKEVDVAIVGAGYCGLCAAIELAENGRSVAVLEAGELGGGASTRNGGMVTGGQKLVVTGAVGSHDQELGGRLLEDAKDSLTMLEARVARYDLDADYRRCGRVILAYTRRHFARLERWAELLREHTAATVSLIRREALQSEIGGDYYHGGLLIEDYGGLHPAKYHRALRQLAARLGAGLHSHAPVRSISGSQGAFTVKTDRGEVRARDVFVATNGYTDSLLPFLQRRVIPVRSYVIATEPLPAELMHQLAPHQRMFSDTRLDLYYFRPSPDGTRIVFGARPGARDVSEEAAARRLHGFMCEVWPELSAYRVSHAWTGYVGMSFDKLPHMGERDGIHYAVGCNGSGVAMMSYLGYTSARKLLAMQNRPCAFESISFPSSPLYGGHPWFVPWVSGYYRLRDSLERRLF